MGLGDAYNEDAMWFNKQIQQLCLFKTCSHRTGDHLGLPVKRGDVVNLAMLASSLRRWLDAGNSR